MALHPDFPASPDAVLDPSLRWFPAGEALREMSADKLMPTLVTEFHKQVRAFRDSSYAEGRAYPIWVVAVFILSVRRCSCVFYNQNHPNGTPLPPRFCSHSLSVKGIP